MEHTHSGWAGGTKDELDAAIASGVFATPPKRGDAGAEVGAEAFEHVDFSKLDKNGDGLLDSSEVVEPVWSKLVAAADKDGDGKVSLAELNALCDKQDQEGAQG